MASDGTLGESMRAIGIRAFGGVDVLEALAVEDPAPGEGQVRVKVVYSGVSWIDVHVRRGAFVGRSRITPEWPLILGYEGAGIVDALGTGTTGLAVGDRVAWSGVPGAHGEACLVPGWQLVPVPDAMPLDIACALQLDGAMAHALSVSAFPIRANDRVLVHSGADPCQLLLIQIAKAQGAEVAATVEVEADAAAPLAAGADHVVVLADGVAEAELAEVTRGQGFHVVYDPVGRDTFALSLASCRRRGLLVLYDGVSGPVDDISPAQLAAAGSLSVSRPHLPDYMQDQTEVRWRIGGLFDAWLAGRLEVRGGRILPMEAAREAHMALEARMTSGKILLQVSREA